MFADGLSQVSGSDAGGVAVSRFRNWPRMSERVMSGKVAFLPSQVEPQTPYAALMLALYDPLFQSIKNCVTSRATIYVQRGCICKGFWHSRF